MMKRTLFILMLILFLLYGTGSFPNQGSLIPYDGVVVEWKPVEGAVGYRVEIKNSRNNSVASFDVDGNRLEYKLSEGSYYIRIGALNRLKKVDSFSNWSPLEVIESVMPVIEKLSVSSFFAGEDVKGIRLTGGDFREGSRIYIQKGSEKIEGKSYKYISDNEVVFDLDLDDARPGKYDLVAENPGGLKAVKENSVLVQKPAVDLSELPAGTVYFASGWEYSYLLADWADIYNNSLLGFRFIAGFNLRAFDAIKSVPVLSSLSMEGDFIYASYDSLSRTGIVDTSLNQYITGASVCWLYALPRDFTVVLRAGCGVVFSSFKEKRQFSESKDFSSRDFFWKAGLSLQYDIAASIFAEICIDYFSINYSETAFTNLRPGIKFGYRI